MNKDLLQKHKDLEEKIKIIVLVLQKTSTLINAKIQSQLNLLVKSTDSGKTANELKQTITHYTHFMDSLGLLILTSVKASFNRKLMKTTKSSDKLTGYFNKWKDSTVDFWNHAKSTLEPLEYFASIYDPRSAGQKDKKQPVSSIADIIKIITNNLDEIKKMTDTLDSDKKIITTGGDPQIIEDINEMLGGYSYETGGDSDDQQITPFTDASIQSNLAKIALIKNTLANNNYKSVESYLNDVVLPALNDVVGPDPDTNNNILLAIKNTHMLEVFNEDLREPLDAYIQKHSNKYSKFIDISKGMSESDTIIIGGIDHETLIEALSKINSYKNSIKSINEIDKNILVGIGIDEFNTVNNVSSISQVQEQHRRLQELIQNIQHEPKRPEVISKIINNLEEAERILNQVEQECSKTSKLTFPSIPKTSELTWEIQNAINKMEVWMDFVKSNITTIRNIERSVLEGSEFLDKAHKDILTLIGPSVETCIMRPARILQALVHKNVMSHILNVRFENPPSDVKKYLSDLKITETHPSVNIYNNGLKISDLYELAETLL